MDVLFLSGSGDASPVLNRLIFFDFDGTESFLLDSLRHWISEWLVERLSILIELFGIILGDLAWNLLLSRHQVLRVLFLDAVTLVHQPAGCMLSLFVLFSP